MAQQVREARIGIDSGFLLPNQSRRMRVVLPMSPPFIRHQAVAWLSGQGGSTWVYYADGQRELISIPLLVLLDRMPNLIRIHKQAAINPLFLASAQLINLQRATVLIRYADTDRTFGVGKRWLADVKQVLRRHRWGAGDALSGGVD
jgi:DNA-binding LytR/AlgR family response regulator